MGYDRILMDFMVLSNRIGVIGVVLGVRKLKSKNLSVCFLYLTCCFPNGTFAPIWIILVIFMNVYNAC